MADTNVSLIDLKALSEPACKLIDSVSGAIGALYEPTRIRRKAEAEADAKITLAKGEQKVLDLEARAAERRRGLELRRQKNVESITRKAVEELPGKVSNEPVDEDWVYSFFEQCQDVSNEQMQTLWARLLAGEVARPGSFSPRSLALVKLLRPHEAQIFTRFCTCVWRVGGAPEDRVPILYTQARLQELIGISFIEFLHLQSLGLIQYSTTEFHVILGPETTQIQYFDSAYDLKLPEGQPLVLGRALLSDIGRELVLLAGAAPGEAYLAQTLAAFQAKNPGATLTKADTGGTTPAVTT